MYWLIALAVLAAPPQKKHKKETPAPVAAEEPAAPKPWWPPTATVGPAKVAVTEASATIELPDGFIYLGREDTKGFLELTGNKAGPHDVGTILPKQIDKERVFFVSVEYEAAGYVKDDDADKLDGAALLQSIREGTEASNEFRIQKGFKPLHVLGWAEAPRYDRASHQIVWAINGHSDDEGDSVNFNTRVLGRAGFLSLDLVCAPKMLGELKPMLAGLLVKTSFDPGSTYADFKPGKDKVAEYGLAALVVGGAAVAGKAALKVGLLSKLGAIILGAKKLFILIGVAIAGFFRKLFGRKKAAEVAPPAPPAT
jgi:uncharacterized membrane-anchored protein